MAIKQGSIITARAEIFDQETLVDLDLTFPEDGGGGTYSINQAWIERTSPSPERLEALEQWVGEVNSRSERLENEALLAGHFRTRFTSFMEAQGFLPTFDAPDGTRVFERTSADGQAEVLAFRSFHDIELEFKEAEIDLVERELSGAREKEGFPPIAFDGLEGETLPFTQFLSREGLATETDMAAELRGWRDAYDARAGVPNPLGIRARGELGVTSAASEQVEHALVFAACLRDQGFKEVGVFDGLPLHQRSSAATGDEYLIWRIGRDGEPAFKLLRERVQDLPFGYESLAAPERDFASFLRDERLPLDRLPAGYALALPFPTSPEHVLQALPRQQLEGEQARPDDRERPREVPIEDLLRRWGEEQPSRSPTPAEPSVPTANDVAETKPAGSPAPTGGGDSNFWLTHAQATTFLRAQGFEPAGWLPDQTRLFFRPDLEEPAGPNGLPAGQLIAIRVDERGQLLWRPTDRGEAQRANGYAELSAAEKDVREFLRGEGLRTEREVDAELRVWARWQETSDRMPPTSVRQAVEDRARTASEVERALQASPAALPHYLRACGFDVAPVALVDGTRIFVDNTPGQPRRAFAASAGEPFEFKPVPLDLHQAELSGARYASGQPSPTFTSLPGPALPVRDLAESGRSPDGLAWLVAFQKEEWERTERGEITQAGLLTQALAFEAQLREQGFERSFVTDEIVGDGEGGYPDLEHAAVYERRSADPSQGSEFLAWTVDPVRGIVFKVSDQVPERTDGFYFLRAEERPYVELDQGSLAAPAPASARGEDAAAGWPDPDDDAGFAQSFESSAVGLEALAGGGDELADGRLTPPEPAPQAATTRFEALPASPLVMGATAPVPAPSAEIGPGGPSAASLDRQEEVEAIGPLDDLHGPGAAASRLSERRRELAEAAPPMGGVRIEHAGLVAFGPERARAPGGRELSRVLLWNVDQTTGLGKPVVVMFDSPFGQQLSQVRPGDFLSVQGRARAGVEAGPWQTWATAVALPNGTTLAPHLAEAPPSDAIVVDAFAQPHLHRNEGRIPSPPTFAAALQDVPLRLATSLDQAKLTETLQRFVATRGLGGQSAELLRYAVSGRNATLPSWMASDLYAWAGETGWTEAFSLETKAAAIESRFHKLAPVDRARFNELGISESTLGAPQFVGALRMDGASCVAVTREGGGTAEGLVRTPLASLPQPERLLGSDRAVWISGEPALPCSKVVIAQTPLAALAYHERHPDPAARYVAIGGDVLTRSQQRTLDALIAAESARNPRERLEVVVTGHHKARGRELLESAAAACRSSDCRVVGALPPVALGGADWIEAARCARTPERLVDLPAYAANRLGYQYLLRSNGTGAPGPDRDPRVVMGLPDANLTGPRSPDGFSEKLLFTRAPDGAWTFQNDKSHPTDRGDAAAFARSRLQLSLDEFRADLRLFALEQEIKKAPALRSDSRELFQQGIYPDTIAASCFRGFIRQDQQSRLVFALQDAKGFCGFQRLSLGDDGAASRLEGAPGLWASNARPGREPINTIVLVRTPLDALAYHQQNPSDRARYVAVGDLVPRAVTAVESPDKPGVLAWLREPRAAFAERRAALEQENQKPAAFELGTAARAALAAIVATAREAGPVQFVVACDRGRDGQEFASAVQRALRESVHGAEVKAHPPAFGHDWRENVRSREREFIRAQGGGKREAASLSL